MPKKKLTFSEMLQKKIDKLNKRHADNEREMARYKRQPDGSICITDMLSQIATDKGKKVVSQIPPTVKELVEAAGYVAIDEPPPDGWKDSDKVEEHLTVQPGFVATIKGGD